MMIAIVDYKAGNLTSVRLAVKAIGAEAVVTSNPEIILRADKLIFPGVGAAGSAMENIHRLALAETLKAYLNSGRPFLGICLGAQIILDTSLENGGTSCLGLLPGTTGLFQSAEVCPLKVPQIGWNQVDFTCGHPLFQGIPSGSEFYFVHSYYPVPAQREHMLATTTYGDTGFTSVLGHDNLVACQFHPEKSGKWGLALLNNFCAWRGEGPPC